jgi:hypothetical protein
MLYQDKPYKKLRYWKRVTRGFSTTESYRQKWINNYIGYQMKVYQNKFLNVNHRTSRLRKTMEEWNE